MIPHDYHLHSNFSCDCKATMVEMCRSAIAKGIPEIGFTEHYDLHSDESCRDWFKPDAWWAELERCRAEFAGQLTLRAGIEIGEPHIFQDEARAVLARYPFDYALGSLHWIGRESIFTQSYFQQRPAATAFRLFFEELERMTRTGGFEVLSHFDVLMRVGYEVYGDYDPRRYEEHIRPILRNCVEHGIALDLNTAALRRKYAAGVPNAAFLLTPGPDILRWYVELGGERITLGSDAHRPQHVGFSLLVALDAARAAGLKYLTQFEGRQAQMVSL
ncbi:MAG: histidinol-phosphatase HisJ family protein [Anaerolineales bacterium]